ncbi:MAG: hypothetical protein ACYDBJ_25485 [Aggregatilineales bacterium]
MTKQTEPENSLHIEQVACAAREALLRDGRHPPTLIAVGSGKSAFIAFDTFGKSAPDNQQQLRQTGFRLAHDQQFGMLKQAFFISEAWMSQLPMDQQPTVRPSQSPNRQEILIIAGLAADNPHASLRVYELIRDHKGGLRDVTALEPADTPFQDVNNPLLEAFFVGFATGQMRKN